MPLYPQTEPLQSGRLSQQDGHSVYWETLGDPSRPAMLLLHGGPGGGIAARMPRLFDPSKWHIVAMDQRGGGRSEPHAGDTLDALRDNTTDHLISDIERLRIELGIAGWYVYGSSWGATLAQAYAHAQPERTMGMILAAVTSTSRFEIDFLYGGAGDFLPEAFEDFLAGAPEGVPGMGMAAAYGDRLMSGERRIEEEAARNWCQWEEAVLQVDPRAEPTGRFEELRFSLGFARVVTLYFRNLAWLEPPLLEQASALADIPAILINSRVDLSTPLSTAWRLHKAMPRSKLVVIPGALHGTLYGPLSEAVIEAGNSFADDI
ncbi:alpha/beta fold hydrolase [Hoeflea prorocentri]|uniref:Proline iminopeptidase n=1 Tax=Hoeflea prorocentri TaxID=1922333 RepID=A0A9X3UFW1_9HYPH|nr:alpha/beta fold hydrolase [Hoeflea prorocentri]MCY6379790.1 alpha/beta fold hydrolase [Hoeflea prorocentri]MDA5397590.1 alpha/beta fold hydrolase [Hoeflea prorocentri]